MRLTEKPMMFLDIDGVFLVGDSNTARMAPFDDAVEFNGGYYSKSIVQRMGRIISDYADPYWLTKWGRSASQAGREFGWPKFPYLSPDNRRIYQERPIDWKYRRVIADAGNRPFVWIDNEIDGQIRHDAPSRFRQPHLLVIPQTEYGIAEWEVTQAERFMIKYQPRR